jgi:hypothetical protein
MIAKVQIRHGNMFDGPSDMIVLPCNTQGGSTPFVIDHLQHFRIPLPKTSFDFGEVDILPLTGGENIAQYVAFSASVMEKGETPSSIIRKIGKQLGKATQTNDSIKAISAPLLGAGAGGLSSIESAKALRDGFLGSAVSDAILTISVLQKTDFNELRDIENEASDYRQGDFTRTHVVKTTGKKHRVFISYTNTTPKHREWVKDLATYLRKNGIEARLDVWHLRHGMDLPQWMCNELQMADKVIIVSDEAYAQKANGRHGGVGWETMIIQGDMADLPPESTKYLTIVKSECFEDGVPLYLKTKYAIHWTDGNEEQLRNMLLRELLEVSSEPPIGEPPFFI